MCDCDIVDDDVDEEDVDVGREEDDDGDVRCADEDVSVGVSVRGWPVPRSRVVDVFGVLGLANSL